MTEKEHAPASPDTAQALRRRAEVEFLAKQGQLPENLHTLTPSQAQKLLHELRVHQMELELQNEELHAAQSQLQAAQARYFDLYDQAPVGYLTLDMDGLILTANYTAAKLFAAEKRAFAGEPLTKFIVPEDQDIFYLHRRQLARGAAKDCELRMLGAGDSPFCARLTSSTGPRADGAPLWRITVTDITETRQAQDAAAQAAREWQKTFDGISDAVWLLDADFRVRRANRATEQVFGRAAGGILGKHCYEIAHGTSEPVADCPLQRAKNSIRRESTELKIGGKTFEVIVDPVLDEAGRFNGAVHIVTDITDRKRGEAEKERLLAQLDEKRREMESFLYITTHDLRTPLVNIQGFSQNLDRDIKELEALVKPAVMPEESRASFEEIVRERVPGALGFIEQGAQKMDQVITSMLKISRAGSVELHPKKVDINDSLKNVLDILRYQLDEAGGAVKAGDLPPCTADPESVSHIFANLLANAVKYRDRNRKLEITVKGERNGGNTVLYSIADNGLGIKAADLPRIWQIFYSGNVPGVQKGEGIGLPLVRRLADKNSGRIWAESKEGEGSTFFVELPA